MTLTDDAAVDLLEGLVRIQSLSTQEHAAVTWLVERMRDLGLDAHADEAGNAVGMTGGGSRQIVLLGHIDTVGGVVPVRCEDGALYGRGSVDAKGPLATFVAATVRARIPDGWQVVVIGAVEEEYATSKGARYAATQYHPAMCVIGEPSRWDRITLGYKGRVLARYRLAQPVAHTAGQAIGAPEVAVAYWNRVAAWAAAYNVGHERVTDQVTPSLRDIHTTNDGLSEAAEMLIGVRLPVGLSPDEAVTALTTLAGDAEVEFSGHETAYRADKNNALARGFLRAIRGEGGTPAFKVKTGTSDMNVVGPVWNAPVVAYGPGDSSLDHTPNEHVAIDEYLRAIRVLTRVLETVE